MILIRHVEREHITHIILYNIYTPPCKNLYIIIMINPMFDAPHVYYMWFFLPEKTRNSRIIYTACIWYYKHYGGVRLPRIGVEKNNKRIIHRRKPPQFFRVMCVVIMDLWWERKRGERERKYRKIHSYTILYNVIGR